MGPPAPQVRPDTTAGKTTDVGGLKLRRTHGGGYLYRDAKTGFTAEIRPDGSVRFRDAKGPKDGNVRILGVDVIKGEKQPEPKKPFRDDIVPYGPYGPAPVLGTAGFRMGGLKDALVKSRKYKEKQRFLELTETLRNSMTAKARDRRTSVALVELSHQLLRIWRDKKLPLSIRKEKIFAQWDDCDEPAKGTKSDRHPGARARRRIEKFVRVHAPAGSEGGFTAAELRDMNKRRKSRERFEPYKRK